MRQNNEITILYSALQRQHDAHKTKLAHEFIKKNPHYLKVVTLDDINGFDFSFDPNGKRNLRRKIFTNIAERSGKDIPGYKIARELAIE